MWISEFELAGIIKDIKPYKVEKNRIPKRSKFSGRQDMELIRGLRIKKKWRIQKYNHEKGIIEPVDDIKDVNLKFYHIVELRGAKNKEGKEKKLKIKLTDQEMKTLIQLESNNEKMQYLLTRAKEQGAIKSFEAKPKKIKWMRRLINKLL